MATDKEIANNQYLREKNGYAPNPLCPSCNGAGFVHPLNGENKPVYADVVPCIAPECLMDAKQQYMKTSRYLVVHGISTRLQTFDRFVKFGGTIDSFNAFYALAQGDTNKPFLLCLGGTGNGKTHLCQALTTTFIRRGINANYFPVATFMSALKESIESNAVEILVKTFSNMQALILDDFGSENFSEWGLAKLEQVIDNRWTEQRYTVMTTNKTLTEFQRISPRMFSRMCDQDISQVVVNEGGDYRVGKRQNL
jgi:DNA replication protein DnaC